MGQVLSYIISLISGGKQNQIEDAKPYNYNRLVKEIKESNEKYSPKEERKIKHYSSSQRILLVSEGKITHYSSSQRILLVGEGDFSFSACLAIAFGSASNIVATSLDSTDFLRRNYNKAMSNITELKRRGAKVMHGIDATDMANHGSLKDLIFDRIIFNFPLAGFFKHESRKNQLRRNKTLILMFMENAKKLISKNGEIHITHKSNGFFAEWNLELLASNVGLRLKEEVHFNLEDYNGYSTKYGFGGDNNFDCNPSKTYKFAPPVYYRSMSEII